MSPRAPQGANTKGTLPKGNFSACPKEADQLRASLSRLRLWLEAFQAPRPAPVSVAVLSDVEIAIRNPLCKRSVSFVSTLKWSRGWG